MAMETPWMTRPATRSGRSLERADIRLPTNSKNSTMLSIRRLPMVAPSAAATPPTPAAMTWKPIMLQTTWLTGRPNSSESETI